MDIFIIEGSTTFVLGSRCIEENFLIRKFSAGAPIAEIVNKQAQVSQLPILEGPNNLIAAEIATTWHLSSNGADNKPVPLSSQLCKTVRDSYRAFLKSPYRIWCLR